ncbi:hypothetical protein [Phocaeicola faecicola]|jgi:hypothetical protein|nr:hypothetical protein [Phocaeicola faecicola]MCI5743065.1 hypothetical protein [Bacteroides sp.]MDY4601431.1 hypothetical protein [Bacteroides uniformis]MDY4872136.1 hypothetical protein [Phocaeicola faecicola]
MKDLTMTDMVNIHGGSTFSYYVFWFLGRSFVSPAELDKNGMNPVHLWN